MPVDYEEKIRFFTKHLLIFRINHEDDELSGINWKLKSHSKLGKLFFGIFLLNWGDNGVI